MTAAGQPNPIADQIAATFAETTAATLSQITSREWRCEVGAGDEVADAISVRFQTAEGLRGEFSFEIGKRAAVELARLFVGEATPSPETIEPTEDDNEALDELLRTIAGTAATALRAHFGKVDLKFIGREDAEWTPAHRRSLTLAQAERRIALGLAFDKEVLTAKRMEEPASISTSQVSSGVDVPVAAKGSAAVPVNRHERKQSNDKLSELMRDGNLDLLLDVELAVTLRFGRREMLMKDILELSSGSVIELDRQVSEPVDLLVDRRVIAKGEVVIVDGNYGLRVTEVASREQKIACLA
jgi:flagellar motor switch protein FliN/FliY